MKSLFKSFLGTLFISLIIVSCSNDNDFNESTESTDRTAIFDLVGTEEQRIATAEELSKIPAIIEKAGCTLSGDEGCSDNASSEFERYVRECTTYTKNWPPSGVVNTYFRSMVYYVDGDSDINLDNYQDDLQAQVLQVVGSGGAAFVDADIIYWECNDRQNNSCVIQYSVYR
ncbi:hypothetical protein SAMN04487910_0406 [Aquimarina amphilecti]|uniref:Lipoprotein n=1 Tax=Aquimarina amphilecti TaxID=1038014 RepID=A0A1H7GKS5_AQUAM|nr:hypothetical protein [Aquimarina amphilecti]SEK38701.1 hypothetical protein SAMN04487910_0406 [Aquimarina amphilecti]